MPYKSDKQRKYFNANRQQLEAAGVNVGEWNQSSKGLKLPTRATKESIHMQRTEAITKLAAFVRYLGDKVPVGNKAADVGRNQARVQQLHKLAQAIEQTQNLVLAVDRCYAGKSAAYKHRVVSGLVGGLAAKIKQAQRRKQALSLGMSKHPSAGVQANASPVTAGGMKTTGPLSSSAKMANNRRQPRTQKKASGKGKQANIGEGVQQGLSNMRGVSPHNLPPEQQKALTAILAALGVGGSAGMGAAVGSAAGSVAGAERGNTAEGLGRGAIRGAAKIGRAHV